MAKKKKQEDLDEDWFEDDDWEDEKPKKKAKKKKKDKSYAWVWVLAFIVILAILLLIRYKFAAPAEAPVTEEFEEPEYEEETQYLPESEESEGTGDDDGYVYEEPKDVGDSVIDEEEIQTGKHTQHSILGEPTNEDPEHARDITDEPELFSNINCEYDYESEIPYISLRVYNILDEDILISPKGVAKGYNTYFMIRGIVDADPGCGTEVLHPGQYTECVRIGFDGEKYANLPGTNRISVQVPKKTEALIIECPESPVFDEEETDEGPVYGYELEEAEA
ncbi:hypothetical protein ACFL0V_00640 [Nanoarchaeota archaeon]